MKGEKMKMIRNMTGALPIKLIVIVLVLLVAGLGTLKFVKGKKPGKVEKPKAELSLWKMEEFTVNLADKAESHYLKVAIVLEIEGKVESGGGGHGGGGGESPEQVKASDAIITVLTKKTFGELLTASGRELLKKDLIKQLNESLEDGAAAHDPEKTIKVHGVYFTSFAMQ